MPQRYSCEDLAIFSGEERRRLGIGEEADPRDDPLLAWELLYRLEPDLYDRLVTAERLHPGILRWLPAQVNRIVEIGAGSGRLTLELIKRCHKLTAIEPAGPLRERLRRKLDHVQRMSGAPQREVATVQIMGGFFDALPIADRSAELVIACSALTPDPSHGGDHGLAEMERVCAHGGMVVIVWPNHVEWLRDHGFRYVRFEGPMALEFASHPEAVELGRIFYPRAINEIRRRGTRQVPYDVLGVNPPCDLAFKRIT